MTRLLFGFLVLCAVSGVTTSAFPAEILGQSSSPTPAVLAESRVGTLAGRSGSQQALIPQVIAKESRPFDYRNTAGMALTFFAADNIFHLSSLRGAQALSSPAVKKVLGTYVSNGSIPEPVLLLMLGMGLLGAAGLIHLNRAHN